MNLFLLKSRVAAHVRHEHSGKLTLVKEYNDARSKKTEDASQAKVVKLPNLKETAGKLAVTHRMAKVREPQILDNPVIEHKPGAESVAHPPAMTKAAAAAPANNRFA